MHISKNMHSHNPPKQCIAIKEQLWNQNQKVAIFFLHNTSFLQICFCRRGNKIRKGESEFFCCSYYLKLFQCEEKKFKNRQIFCLEYIFCFLSCFPGVVVALLQIRLNVFVSERLFTGLWILPWDIHFNFNLCGQFSWREKKTIYKWILWFWWHTYTDTMQPNLLLMVDHRWSDIQPTITKVIVIEWRSDIWAAS